MGFLRFLFAVILQIGFGLCAAIALLGIPLVAYKWRSPNEEVDYNVLAVFAILLVVLGIAGIWGILVTRKRARGGVDAVEDYRRFRDKPAKANVLAGGILIVTALAWAVFIRRVSAETGMGLPIWSGPLAIGLVQLIYGLRQWHHRTISESTSIGVS